MEWESYELIPPSLMELKEIWRVLNTSANNNSIVFKLAKDKAVEAWENAVFWVLKGGRSLI